MSLFHHSRHSDRRTTSIRFRGLNEQHRKLRSSYSLKFVTDEYEGRFEKNAVICSVLPGPDGDLILPGGRGKIHYVREFLIPSEATLVLTSVQNSSAFNRVDVDLKGSNCKKSQTSAFFGTAHFLFHSDRKEMIGLEDESLASIIAQKLAVKIEHYLSLDPGYFNSVLVNKYSGVHDFMEWHSNNERGYGDESIIVYVSVGSRRELLFRSKQDGQAGKPVDVVRYFLDHGSLILMYGKMQNFYQHAVPRSTDDEMGVRLNFIFRRSLCNAEL